MEAYTGFAEVYDIFMDNVPYEEWCTYVLSLLKEEKIEDGLVLELGCGTGKMTRLLSRAGYDLIGLDNSEEMLDVAHEKTPTEDHILYICQDMCSFELYGTVRAIISVCDSMNYLLDREDFLETLKLANNYLDPKGVFIFDLNTEYKYRELLGECSISENRKECSFIWDNYYDESEHMNEYDLTLFVQEGELFRKYDEVHYQRAYEIEEVKQMITEAGMELVGVYDAFTKEVARQDSERVYFIVREQGKQAKEIINE